MSQPWWMQTDWDNVAKGKVPYWQIFEDFRLWLWILENGLNADFDEEGSGITGSVEWAAYANSLVNKDYYAGDVEVQFIKYRHTSGDDYDWFHLADTSGMSRALLASNTPLTSEGVLDNEWKHAALPHRYQDWNRNSQRYITRKSTTSVGEVVYISSICEPAYRWMMKQTNAKRQRNFVKYTDNDRTIPHLKASGEIAVPVEFARRYITQPETLGPNFNEVFVLSGASWILTKTVSKNGVGKDVHLTGRQYAISGSSPNEDIMNSPGLYPWFADPKNNEALQNQIERVCSLGWWWKVDTSTPQGQAYQLNYEYNLQFASVATERLVEAWDSEETYNQNDWVRDVVGVNVKYWRWNPETAGNSLVSPANDGLNPGNWHFEKTLPKYDDANSDFWGCNGSGFELFLWLTGEYDWYFETSYKYMPEYIRRRIEVESDPIPQPAGNWRRTWKWSMGGPKNALKNNKMRKGDYEPTGTALGPTYDSKVYPFFSLYSETAPTINPDEEESAGLQHRHGPSTVTAEAFELKPELILNCKMVLEKAIYSGRYTEVFAEYRGGQGENSASMESARSAARDDAASKAFGYTTSLAFGEWGQATYSGGVMNYSARVDHARIGILAANYNPAWQHVLETISVRVSILGRFLDPEPGIDFQFAEDKEYQLPDGQTGVATNRYEQIPTEVEIRLYENEHFMSVDLSGLVVSGNYIYVPIIDLNPTAPDVTGHPTTDHFEYMSRAGRYWIGSIEPYLLVFNIGKITSAIINTVGYWQFTEVAEDPDLFNDDGYLKPPIE